MTLPPPNAGILKRVARALLGGLIEPNDRVLLGLSGGKDSLTLLIHLVHLQKHFQIPFHFEAAHIKADFVGCGSAPHFLEWVREWGVVTHEIPVAILGRLKPGKKLNCWWCSTQRRTELLEFARENGFTKVALGHHLDDMIETLLMNMAFKGQVSTMLPLMRYDHYQAVIIRPLAFVSVDQIVAYSRKEGFLQEALTCPFGQNSLRLKVRQAIRLLSQAAPGVKENLLRSTSNIQERYLYKEED